MILRRVDRNDFDSIYDLIRNLGDSGSFVELKYVLENLLNDPQRELVLVADENDRAVALMCLHQGPESGTRKAQITVQELMVHPGFLGMGVEQRLLRFAEDYSRSAEARLRSLEGSGRVKGVIRGNFERGALKCRKASLVEI
jgi:GNAT superfamily N-acetyltransferase